MPDIISGEKKRAVIPLQAEITEHSISPLVADKILKVCKQSAASVFVFLAAGFRVLLSKYLQQKHLPFVIGFGMPGQTDSSYAIIREDLHYDEKFMDILKEITALLSARTHADINSVKSTLASQPAGSEQVPVVLFPDPFPGLPDIGLFYTDLAITIRQSEAITVSASFNSSLYQPSLLNNMFSSLEKVSELVIDSKFQITVSEMPLPDTLSVQENKVITAYPEQPTETYLQKKIRNIFSEALDTPDEIPASKSFFDLGGNSLKSIVLLSRVYDSFGIRIPLHYFRRHPSISEVADLIIQNENRKTEKIKGADQKHYYPALKKQERLFFQQDKESVAYNIPYAIRIKGSFNKFVLQGALKSVVQRHEVLRTRFEVMDGCLLQIIEQESSLELLEIDGTVHDRADILARFVRPFDLHTWPLFRVGLVNMTENEYLLILDMHHIIADGISCMILLQDLMSLYDQAALPPLEYQFKDYSEWYLSRLHTELFESYREYWKERLGNRPYTLNLPYDHKGDENRYPITGKREYFTIDENSRNHISRLCTELQTTSFCLLLSVYQILLMKICNQEEIVTGITTSGRQFSAFEHVMGMFINTIPFKNTVTNSKSFKDFLADTTQLFMEDLDNSELDTEDLVQGIKIENVFVLQNYITKNKFSGTIDWEMTRVARQVSKFNLVLIAIENENRFDVELHYKNKLFSKNTVALMIHYYTTILDLVLTNPSVLVGEIKLLAPKKQAVESQEEDFFYL